MGDRAWREDPVERCLAVVIAPNSPPGAPPTDRRRYPSPKVKEEFLGDWGRIVE